MDKLRIDHLITTYGDAIAIDDVSLAIQEHHLSALLGPSGCGKTTLLRAIAGFVPATAGSIRIGDTDVTRLPPNKRNTGMVFQNYALFPHMTVAENIHFGLKMRNLDPAEIGRRTSDVLKLVHLTGYEARWPRQLSGGQQQRVALARALATHPDVFLMDEPLSNLDAKLRQSVAIEIRNLQKQLGLTTLVVTHDQNEAMMMADQVIIMRAGRIVQQGSPADLYRFPTSRFVAEFVGRTNVFTGCRRNDTFVTTGGLAVRFQPDEDSATGARQEVLSVRPESIVLGREANGQDNQTQGEVAAVTFLGSRSIAEIALATGERIQVDEDSEAWRAARVEVGETVNVGWSQRACQVVVDD